MVATPIGNLRDVTLRALDVLKAVALIAAEDTRVTRRLLQAYGIETPMTAVHEHNEREAAQKLIERLARGESVALVSDAGTPALSDPGARLVAEVRAAGFPVVPVPGPNALVAALSASGIAEPGFLFCGFLPPRPAARRQVLEKLRTLPWTLAFYEAPHRILELVEDLEAVLGGGRTLTFARELTKLFETIHTCTLAEARDWLAQDPNRRKGEFVVLVSGAAEQAGPAVEEAQRVLSVLLAELPLKQAVALAAKITGSPRNVLYELALRLKAGPKG